MRNCKYIPFRKSNKNHIWGIRQRDHSARTVIILHWIPIYIAENNVIFKRIYDGENVSSLDHFSFKKVIIKRIQAWVRESFLAFIFILKNMKGKFKVWECVASCVYYFCLNSFPKLMLMLRVRPLFFATNILSFSGHFRSFFGMYLLF